MPSTGSEGTSAPPSVLIGWIFWVLLSFDPGSPGLFLVAGIIIAAAANCLVKGAMAIAIGGWAPRWRCPCWGPLPLGRLSVWLALW